VHLATDAREADLRLKIFAPVLGVDQGGAFVRVPSVTVPVLGFTTPEVALFKSVTHQGKTAIQIYLFDEQSGQFIDKSPVGNGAASTMNIRSSSSSITREVIWTPSGRKRMDDR
jgi:hypothetical protein